MPKRPNQATGVHYLKLYSSDLLQRSRLVYKPYKHSCLTYRSGQPFGAFRRTVARNINCLFIRHALSVIYNAVSISVDSAE
jgi:hypothetical protein